MNGTDEQRPVRRAAGLAVLVFAAAALLSARTAWDLIPQRGAFPSWFVPLFVAGLAGLVLCAGSAARGIWGARRSARPASGALGGTVWLFVALSFVATSTVHQLYPFRALAWEDFLRIDPMLRFNLALTGVGFAAAAGLGVLYQAGKRGGALVGLFILDLVLLVPNDACANPFNAGWIALCGASPLMFVPNLYASLFAAAALLGVYPRWNFFCLVASCVGVALLGLGHATRVIW